MKIVLTCLAFAIAGATAAAQDAPRDLLEAGRHTLRLTDDGHPIVLYDGEPFGGRLTVDYPSGRRVVMPAGTDDPAAYRWMRDRDDLPRGVYYVTLHHPIGERTGFSYPAGLIREHRPDLHPLPECADWGDDDVYAPVNCRG